MTIFMYVKETDEFPLSQMNTMSPFSQRRLLFSFSASMLSWWGLQDQSSMSLN